MPMKNPPHPGELVKYDCLEALGLSVTKGAATLDFLRVPPGNRLEALHGDRQGQYSLRINEQWRICFVWREGDAFNVEIVDYH